MSRRYTKIEVDSKRNPQNLFHEDNWLLLQNGKKMAEKLFEYRTHEKDTE